MNTKYLKTTRFLLVASIVIFSSCKKEEEIKTLPVQTAKSKKVEIVKPDTLEHIYLTFDDGPNKGTKNVIKVLEQEQVKASTFVVGKHVYDSKKQTADMKSLESSPLIEVCNHSFSHAKNRYSYFYNHKEEVLADFNQCRDSLQFLNSFARTPGRNIWRLDTISATDLKKSAEAADLLEKNGYQLVGWDLEWHYDNENKLTETPEKVMEQIHNLLDTKSTKKDKHLILLMHDQTFSDSLDCTHLTKLIQGLKSKNKYAFHTMSEYPTSQEKL